MKAWLKGGLIGAIAGFVSRVIMIISLVPLGILAYARGWQGDFIRKIFAYPAFPFISYCNSLDLPHSISCTQGFALFNLIVLGALIGTIIGKIKSKKQETLSPTTPKT